MKIGHKNWRDDSIRFWKLVDKTDKCWNWNGSRNADGYGQFHRNGSNIGAHRYSYELNVDKIPEGLVIDHLCRNRSCVNPAHLEPVTQKENCLRGTSPWANNARKTHCKYGHLLSENRRCIICRRSQQRKYKKKKREMIRALKNQV